MPATRAATLRVEDLPAVATASEISDFERCDVRVLRADMEAGRVPGAYRRGRSWRVNTAVYLASFGNSRIARPHAVSPDASCAGQDAAASALRLRGGERP